MEKQDPYKILEFIRTCINRNNVKYVEILVTPIRQGFKVEIYPEPEYLELERVAYCLSSELKCKTSIEELRYGKVITINPFG
ncbi:MAG: hypothetical protein QXE81_02370 [Desulfurococcaceae archaeon]